MDQGIGLAVGMQDHTTDWCFDFFKVDDRSLSRSRVSFHTNCDYVVTER